MLSRQAGSASATVSAVGDVERTRLRCDTRIEIATDLSASLAPSEVIRRVLVRAVAAGRADRGVLLQIEGEDTVVEDFYDVAGDSDQIGYRHPIAFQPLMQQAVTSRLPVIGGRYDVSRFAAPSLEASLGSVRQPAPNRSAPRRFRTHPPGHLSWSS